jgi:hypothetical protein
MKIAFHPASTPFLDRLAVGGGLLLALLLLAVFYSTVTAAVDRAGQRRSALAETQAAAPRAPARAVVTATAQRLTGREALPRNVSYLRPAN